MKIPAQKLPKLEVLKIIVNKVFLTFRIKFYWNKLKRIHLLWKSSN